MTAQATAGKPTPSSIMEKLPLICSFFSQQHPCGAQNPTRVNVTSSSSSTASRTASGSSTASATGDTADYSGFGTSGSTPSATAGAATDNTNTSAAAVLNLAQSYGFAVVFAGFFASFALLL